MDEIPKQESELSSTNGNPLAGNGEPENQDQSTHTPDMNGSKFEEDKGSHLERMDVSAYQSETGKLETWSNLIETRKLLLALVLSSYYHCS